MPTYSYACLVCSHRFDAVQSMTDEPLAVCPVCSGGLRRVFGTVGVTFKGSGFYRTDSRPNKKSGSGSSTSSSPSSSGGA